MEIKAKDNGDLAAISIEDARKVIELEQQERQRQLQASLAQWQQENNADFVVFATRDGVSIPIGWLLPSGWGVAIVPRGR